MALIFLLFVLRAAVLFILKVDEAVSGSWFAIWIPMLLVDGILMMNTVIIVVRIGVVDTIVADGMVKW